MSPSFEVWWKSWSGVWPNLDQSLLFSGGMVRRLNRYRVFIKYCVFSKILKYFPDSGLSRLPLDVSVCTHWQVKHQRCSRTGRFQKNHNILRKNTIFNGHPVPNFSKLYHCPFSVDDALTCGAERKSSSLDTVFIESIPTTTVWFTCNSLFASSTALSLILTSFSKNKSSSLFISFSSIGSIFTMSLSTRGSILISSSIISSLKSASWTSSSFTSFDGE